MAILNEKIAMAAEIAHMANKTLCEIFKDRSQPTWEDAPDWQVDSALNGVMNVIDHPGMTAEQNHENWVEHKLADGWKYGPVKDADKKEHPCMVPFKDLPEHEQIKDRLFLATVKAVLGL